MKAPVSTAVAIGVGLIILAGYFLRGIIPAFDSILAVLLQWAVILAAVATLLGIMNLLNVHWKKIVGWKKDAFYSLVTLLAFLMTIMVGIIDGPTDSRFKSFVLSIQIPVEASLMAVLAVTLAWACVQFLHRRSFSLLAISFFLSAILFLLFNLGFITSAMASIPFLKAIVVGINQLPVGGTRGILIGIALGTLTTGLRVLLGGDRPYGG